MQVLRQAEPDGALQEASGDFLEIQSGSSVDNGNRHRGSGTDGNRFLDINISVGTRNGHGAPSGGCLNVTGDISVGQLSCDHPAAQGYIKGLISG